MISQDTTSEIGLIIADLMLNGEIWTRWRLMRTLITRGHNVPYSVLEYHITRLTLSGKLNKLPAGDGCPRRYRAASDTAAIDAYILGVLRRPHRRAA